MSTAKREFDRVRDAHGKEVETSNVTSDRFQLTINSISDQSPFPNFSKPLIVGCFSLIKSDRFFVEGPGSLKFCHLPATQHVNFDLNRHVQQHPNAFTSDAGEEASLEETSSLVHLLNWIKLHEERFKRRRPHFVFYRGLMTKLLCTPYETKDGWKIAAMIKNGTIYICNLETPDSISNRQKFNSNPRLRRTGQWGHAFEHFLLSDDPLKKPDPSTVNIEECNFVFHAKLGNHDLLYAAEIDGIMTKPGDDSNPKKRPDLLSKSELVELKTTRQFPNGQMPNSFRRHNLRKWWCQSFTVGVTSILMGLRDDEGVIHELKLLPLEMLPKLAATEWSSTVCFNFLESLLTELKKVVGDESSVYVIEYKPERRVQGKFILGVECESHSTKMLNNTI